MRKLGVLIGLMLLSVTVQAKSIVVLGDSISAGYGMDVNQGWVSLLQQRLQKTDPTIRLYNESISGETTAGGLARIKSILKQRQPDIVIIELGANDGLRGLSPIMMKQNLGRMIELSQNAGAKVLLLSMRIPPNYGKRYTKMFYQTYAQLGEQYAIPVVPFLLEDVALAKELMQQDGLHPNQKAQALIAEKVWQYLNQVL
ncbi:arylesterase [methane-oxidizing endosymbiont of Gigantopelta aegis]|uniref:arylesterase n=1 Tax=methane-oxidizing endosymbiont of Gigantopelta aegis TaxID=2794938 RepID=UPI0018DEB084|nr:arylesterase [methane-oxidizing endosymbiont of Gigantopelta aegis]